MNHDAHTLREFDAALTSLNTYLLQMAYKAQSALDLAVAGLLQQDEDPANQAIADDEELDELEMAVDREGMHLLAFFSPVASDLRVVLASIRLSAIYERMGDESVTIAKRANKLNKGPASGKPDWWNPCTGSWPNSSGPSTRPSLHGMPRPWLPWRRDWRPLAEKNRALTETFARLPEHYRTISPPWRI